MDPHSLPSERPPAASQLAAFAAQLRLEDIPAAAAERAVHCLTDAVACALFGARFPWCRMVLGQTSLDEDGGFLPASSGAGKGAIRDAALAWGTQAHAFELDSLCRPSAGVHPGATVALPALAVARARHASGKELIRAIVAGCEVMFRIGTATLHSPEKRGFHAPGLNGPFGAAIACGSLLGLSAAELANALGIAGSLGSGLLAFSKAERGGMVKRLHMGRAAEGGVLAAQLAADRFEGPDTVLDGRFGMLEAYCNDSDPALLTAEIGTQWKILTLCLKPFACHITAHCPAQLVRDLMREHAFGADDITALRLGVSAKVLSHHASRAPADLMQAQYSVPYVTAIAAHRDPSDPRSFSEDALSDPHIRALAERIALQPRRSGGEGWGVEMSVTLRGDRTVDSALDSFVGCPESPFTIERLRSKFMTLTEDRRLDREEIFRRLASILLLEDVAALWPS
ncbi:MAG TPA: MmgE/PrpD family protein [Dongiaceae bacterium]|nr:MmgE/PrpD family protein [Dongiaceae bacterium]